MAEDASASALDDHEYVGGLERGLLQDAANGEEHGFSYEEARDVLTELAQRACWQEQNVRYLNRIIRGLSDTLDVFSDPQNFAAAKKQADNKLVELNAFVPCLCDLC